MNNSSHSPKINAAEVASRLNNGEHLHLLDVRDELEYHTYNIGGVNIPLAHLANNLDKLGWDKGQEIIVVCKIGLRSKTAQSILKENGYQHIRNLEGGLMALRRS